MLFRVLAVLSGLILATAAGPTLAQNIDTTDAAQTNNNFAPFGVPDTATYGQTITIPTGANSIASFGFEMNTVPSTVVFRGAIYLWDGVNRRATGPALYESGPRSTTGATKQIITFAPSTPVAVTAGQQYVIFASTSRDQAGASGTGSWDANNSASIYGGGDLVFINNGTDTAAWTTSTWSVRTTQDFGFTANFISPAPVPTMTEWAMILFGVILAGGAALYVQRRRQIV